MADADADTDANKEPKGESQSQHDDIQQQGILGFLPLISLI